MAAEAPPRPLLRQRNFLALIGGQLVSISGERLTLVALNGLLLLHTRRFSSLAQSSLLLWLLGVAQLLPVLLFSPFVGAWVDRCNLKRVMVVSDTLRAAIVMLIPVCYLATHSVWPVNLLVFALFTCNVFFLPAKSAIMPEIVPGGSLLMANTLLAGAGIAGTVVAMMGGWAVDHWGWGPGLYLNGATYLVSVVSLLLIRYRPAERQAALPPVSMRNYLHEVAEGWRLVRSTPVAVLALTAHGAVWAGGGFALVAGMQHIQRAAGALAGMERVTVLMAAAALGSAFGIWWVNTRGRAHPRHVVLGAGLVLAAAGLVGFAVSTRFAVFAGAALLVGLGAAPIFVLPETMLQEGTEPRQRGRVFSARDFLMRLMLLGGQSVAGIATPLIGTGPTMLVAAGMMVLVGVLAFVMGRRIPRPRRPPRRNSPAVGLKPPGPAAEDPAAGLQVRHLTAGLPGRGRLLPPRVEHRMSERACHPEPPAGGLKDTLRHEDGRRDAAGRELPGAVPPPASPWTAEQRYRCLVAASADGIWRFALDPPLPLHLPEGELALAILERARLAECNRAYARGCGFEEPGELVGCCLADVMPGSRDEQLGALLEFVRSGFQLSGLETAGRDRAGRPFFVRNHVVGMVENGRLAGGWGTQRDLEQRQAEEGLRASESHFRSLIENVSDVVTLMDADGTIRFESPSVERVFGYGRDELVGRNAFDLLHPDDRVRISADLARLLRRPGAASPVTELRARHRDGSWRTFEVVGKCLAATSGPPSIVMSFRDVSERRRTDEALREAEWKFMALFEKGPIGVAYHEMIYDPSGRPVDYRFLDANGRYRELTGVDPRGMTVTQAFPGIEQDPFDWIGTYSRVVRTGEQVRFEQYLQANGRWYDIVAYPYKPGHFVTAFLDITERKRTERSLRLAQHSVEIAADAIFWLRPDASISYANSAACRLLGHSREELLRLTAFDLNPGRTPENWAAHWDRIRQEQSYSFEAEFRTKAGDPLPVEITAGYLEFDGEVYCFSFVRDIRRRRQTEEHLAILAAAVEQAADDILVTDAEGRISYVNSAFERTTGYSRAEALGRSPRFLDSGRHEPAFYRSIDATIANRQTWHGRFSNRTKDGRTILEDASISPILDASGRIVGQVSARRDVTRQVELESHVAQADKLEAIGTMAGGIAHDFNNILSAILGYTQMAMRKCPEDSAIHRDLQAVLLGSRRAADLVRQILTFSRHQQRAEQPVQVGLIVKEAAKFLRASIPATVEIRTDVRSDATVLAEPTDLHRIVINLCTNAALAMQDHGGLLRLGLAEVDLDASFTSRHTGMSPGRFVRLTVHDTGHGMTPEVQARIFEPFFTTRECGEGTGMGLAVVHGIVTRSRGAITVESEPGRGTTFEIHLPVIDRAAPAADLPPEALVTGTESILVVDDEPLVAAMVVEQLNELGYHATACANGLEALAAFTADPRGTDLVVTDMTMPGMTGDVLARRLKSLRPDLPVILCTGYSDRVTAETAHEQGIDEFAMKPLAMAKLSRLVRRALDRH